MWATLQFSFLVAMPLVLFKSKEPQFLLLLRYKSLQLYILDILCVKKWKMQTEVIINTE